MFNSEAQLGNNGGVDSSDEHRALAMREYLDAVPHHVWTADSTGTRITWFNRRWHEYSGQTPEPAGALAAGLKAQGPFTADVRLRSKDGQFCWFQIRGEPVRQGERIVSWIGTNTDIHEQHLATQARDPSPRANPQAHGGLAAYDRFAR